MTHRTLMLKLAPQLTKHEVLKVAITMEKAEHVEVTPVPTVPVVALVREEGLERRLTSIEAVMQNNFPPSAGPRPQ